MKVMRQQRFMERTLRRIEQERQRLKQLAPAPVHDMVAAALAAAAERIENVTRKLDQSMGSEVD